MPELASSARKITRVTSETQELPAETGMRGLGGPIFEYLDTLPDEHVGLTDVWIYRTDTPGMQTYVKKLVGSAVGNGIRIDEEWIRSTLGGGIYRVKVTTKGIASGFESNIRVEGAPKPTADTPAAAAPPASENGDAKSMSRLCDLLERVIMERREPATPPPNAATEAAIGVVADGAKKIIEMVASNAKPPAPASPLSDLTTLLAFVEKLRPQESDVDKALKQALISQLTNPKKSAMDELEQLVKMRELVDGLGGGGKGDWKTTLAEAGVQKLPEIVNRVADIFEAQRKRSELETIRAQTVERIRAAAAAPPPAAISAPGSQAAPTYVVPAAAPSPVTSAAGPWAAPIEITSAPGDIAGTVDPAQVYDANLAASQPAAVSYDDGIKRRIVELVFEGAEPNQVLDFIDSAMPLIGAQLTHASAAQVKEFIEGDATLAQVTKYAGWNEWFEIFLQELAESKAALPAEPVQ